MRRLTEEEYRERITGVMAKIDRVCRENNYKYMICYGTLIGAVRHKGFIPWDDDIDIVMPREDYYKLGEYIESHPELDLNYIDISNREDTIFYGAKVCDAHTVIKKEANFRPVKGYGAFVDIFPLDYLPDDPKKREAYRKKALHWERIVQHSASGFPKKEKNAKHYFLLVASYFYSHMFDTGKMLHKMHDTFISRDSVKTGWTGQPWGRHFRTEDFEETTELEFEGHMFLAPKNYDRVLRDGYGDYMTLPPENERQSHYIECWVIEE